MPIELGMISQYGDPVSKAQPDIVALAAAVEPTFNKGAFWQACGAPVTPLNTVEFVSYSRSKTTKTGTVGAWNDTDTTGLEILTGIKGILVKQVMKIENEWVQIKSVSVTNATAGTGTISVFSRGTAGTAAATHASGSAFELKMSALNDKDLKDVSSFNEVTGKYENYAQFHAEIIEYTKRYEDLKRDGLSAAQATTLLKEEKFISWFELAAENAIQGRKQVGAENGDGYMTAGLIYQLKDTAGVGGSRPVITHDASGAFTETVLREALAKVVKTGNPDTIWLSNANQEIANSFSSTRSTNRTDTQAGSYIDEYLYNGRVLKIKVDADMPDTDIAIVTSSKCMKRWVVADQLKFNDEPSLSSREKRESLTGSVGIDIQGVGFDHVIIYGITS